MVLIKLIDFPHLTLPLLPLSLMAFAIVYSFYSRLSASSHRPLRPSSLLSVTCFTLFVLNLFFAGYNCFRTMNVSNWINSRQRSVFGFRSILVKDEARCWSFSDEMVRPTVSAFDQQWHHHHRTDDSWCYCYFGKRFSCLFFTTPRRQTVVPLSRWRKTLVTEKISRVAIDWKIFKKG